MTLKQEKKKIIKNTDPHIQNIFDQTQFSELRVVFFITVVDVYSYKIVYVRFMMDTR